MGSAGINTVILAFDDPVNVPKAKSITQAARRHNITPIVFEAGQPLPPFPPEPWDAAMANRQFKAAVQQMIVEALPSVLDPPTPDQEFHLLIDWTGPEMWKWTWTPDGNCVKTSTPREQVRSKRVIDGQASNTAMIPCHTDLQKVDSLAYTNPHLLGDILRISDSIH